MMSFNLHGLSTFWIFAILLMLILAYIVYTDANSYGENGTLWFFITLFFPMMGLFFYLLFRIGKNNPQAVNLRTKNYNQARTSPPIKENIRARRPAQYIEIEKNKPENTGSDGFQFCTKCGFQNSLQASFCNSCGAEFFVGEI